MNLIKFRRPIRENGLLATVAAILMFAWIESVRAVAVKVSALRSAVIRTMATGGVLTNAVEKRRVALITGITGQVG